MSDTRPMTVPERPRTAGAPPTVTPLIRRISESVVGDDHVLHGPYGPRRLTYADDTASGRALSFLEELIREEVLPRYANTHTEASATGRQTTVLREDARRIIRDAIGGDESTAVVFCGSGSTAAIDKLIGILNLRIPADLDERYRLSERIPPEERPVVLIYRGSIRQRSDARHLDRGRAQLRYRMVRAVAAAGLDRPRVRAAQPQGRPWHRQVQRGPHADQGSRG